MTVEQVLKKRCWTVYEEAADAFVYANDDHVAGARGLAAFFAIDQTLAELYARALWPPLNGRLIRVEPAEATRPTLNHQARSRFILDCDLALQQRDFVTDLRKDGGGAGGVCMICGCTENNACDGAGGGCWWVVGGSLSWPGSTRSASNPTPTPNPEGGRPCHLTFIHVRRTDAAAKPRTSSAASTPW